VIERLTKVKSYLIVRVNYFTIVKNSFVKKRKFLKYVITQCTTLLLWQEKLGMFGLKSHCQELRNICKVRLRLHVRPSNTLCGCTLEELFKMMTEIGFVIGNVLKVSSYLIV
jgi:hypothetical protein